MTANYWWIIPLIATLIGATHWAHFVRKKMRGGIANQLEFVTESGATLVVLMGVWLIFSLMR
jgi:cytochrome c-type biogenesis protein CcmH/NrfF